METDSPVVYHGTSESRFPANEPQKTQLNFSPEELRILRECNRESFYYRCLPFAVAGMTATYLAVKKGFLSSHPKYGPSLKMTGAAVCGWFVGKMSYRSVCEEKFLYLENSAIGDAIRRKRGYKSEGFQAEFMPPSGLENDNSEKSDKPGYFDGGYHSSTGSLNFDVGKDTQYSELDDRGRPTTENAVNFTSESEPARHSASYDDLRRKNRDMYDQQLRQQQQPKPNTSFSSDSQRSWSSYDNSSRRTRSEQNEGIAKNSYGDTWEK